MIQLTGLFPTEFDETTQSVLNTVSAHGASDEAIYRVRDQIVYSMVRGMIRDDLPAVGDDDEDPVITVLDLVLIGALIRGFFPREKPDGEIVVGFLGDMNGELTLRSAIETAKFYGATIGKVKECAHEVGDLWNSVCVMPSPDHDRSVTILNLMLAAMITHRLVPRVEGGEEDS